MRSVQLDCHGPLVEVLGLAQPNAVAREGQRAAGESRGAAGLQIVLPQAFVIERDNQFIAPPAGEQNRRGVNAPEGLSPPRQFPQAIWPTDDDPLPANERALDAPG